MEVMAIEALVLVSIIAPWFGAWKLAAGSLAVGLTIIIVRSSAERREIRARLRRNAERWGFIVEQVVDSTYSPFAEQEGRVSSSGISEHETAMAATSAVFPGVSLRGATTYTLLHDGSPLRGHDGYRVTCVIEVENWTRFRLNDPHVQLSRGVLTVAPSSIVPAAREVMLVGVAQLPSCPVIHRGLHQGYALYDKYFKDITNMIFIILQLNVARKTSGTATGSCGTVSWIIENKNRRFVIMWSAPFNFNHYSNWLGIGLSAPGVTEHAHGNAWFDLMYYKNSSNNLKFKRNEYDTDVHPVLYRDADFEVEGTMASDHKALVKVILRPVNRDNLASRIKEEMGLR